MNAWVITIAGGIRGTRVVWSRVESLSAAQLLIEQHFDPVTTLKLITILRGQLCRRYRIDSKLEKEGLNHD